jgi:hypothetical protein
MAGGWSTSPPEETSNVLFLGRTTIDSDSSADPQGGLNGLSAPYTPTGTKEDAEPCPVRQHSAKTILTDPSASSEGILQGKLDVPGALRGIDDTGAGSTKNVHDETLNNENGCVEGVDRLSPELKVLSFGDLEPL